MTTLVYYYARYILQIKKNSKFSYCCGNVDSGIVGLADMGPHRRVAPSLFQCSVC